MAGFGGGRGGSGQDLKICVIGDEVGLLPVYSRPCLGCASPPSGCCALSLTRRNLVYAASPQDTVAGFLMAGIGQRDGMGRTNFLVVDASENFL